MMNFNNWMKKVDRIITNQIGVGVDDLQDFMWRDAYDDGNTPAQAVEATIGDCGDDDLMDLMFN